MTLIRSLLFNVWFIGSLIVHMLVMVCLLPFPRVCMQNAVRSWAWAVRWGMGAIAGLKVEIRGRENLPQGPVIIASKHQSAWDTCVFYTLCADPVYVMKKELMRIPLWAPLVRKSEALVVDRAGGAGALKQMVAETKRAVGLNRQVIIFPEGTRAAPGRRHPYHPGVAAMYAATDVPLVPVALNSGLFWGRRSVRKYAGTVVLEFLPPMPRGLKRKDFMAQLEDRIESASAALITEARARYPHLPPAVDERGEADGSAP
ncbi:MAG: 1-acyl-sn-glycerol-3-phosphate acyltransferase [Rhodobacterales bacterium]|nr:1-acyl-sn-glycerol-3-phosphate acyltransferase [Rhodobacterales bacterium]